MSSVLSPSGPVHLDTAQALAQIGDEGAMASMLVMLQESLAQDVPAIAACVQAGDGVQANQMLHALKGFIPLFCRAPICDQLARVELMSKSGVSPEVVQAYALLRPQLELLQSEVVAYLQQTAPAP